MRDGEDDDSSGEGDDDVYRESAEPILVSLSNLYSNDKILVSDSRYFSCPAYTVTDYFALLTTNWYYDFGLRRLFYSKQWLKNYYCFSV